MDKDNPIVKLVNQGMEMEQENKIEFAKILYLQAWDEAMNDQEKCVAAHFVARQQDNPEDALKWNIESLNYANKVSTEEVKSYYPSLYLNIGKSYEELGNNNEAEKYYNLALDKIHDLSRGINNEKYNKGIEETIIEKRNKFKKQ